MSVFVEGNDYLYAYSDVIKQNYYISNYYTLTNQNVFIQYQNLINLNDTSQIVLSGYITNFGDSNNNIFSLPNEIVNYKYKTEGTYYVSYSALYFLNNSTEQQIKTYITELPIIVKSNWDLYNPSTVRLNDEKNLNLPYTLEDIEIQPNEWGDSDIFNTSILRLQECLNYLNAKTQTINTFAPTLFYGWLGNNTGTKSSILKWFTQSYNETYLYNPEMAQDEGKLFFKNVLDVVNVESSFGELLYVLDDKNLRIFLNRAEPIELMFTNGDPLSGFLIDPVSIDTNEDGSIIYVSDKIQNTIFKLKIESNLFGKKSGVIAFLQLFVGGFGALEDNDNFNAPKQIVYRNENLYVIDYNNFCVKVFNKDLNWLYTYTNDEFTNNKPLSVDVLKNGLTFILTETYKVYIFDGFNNEIFEVFDLKEVKDESPLLKICIDSEDNFLQILTEKKLYKYTLAGVYVTDFILPKNDEFKYTNVKRSKNNLFFITSPKCIFKCQDMLQVFKLGEGLESKYWTNDQLIVNKNEFVSDITYNRCLLRMAQNILSFRDTLNAKFIIALENIRTNIVSYFSYIPITEKPVINSDVENLFLGVGINELHIPSVFNKELKKLYFALLDLTEFLSIKNYYVDNTECKDSFCWSWNATSCYELKLPVLRTCSINPISYQEILISEVSSIKYAPTYSWEQAISKCCEDK
jgi:hypothetical protein